MQELEAGTAGKCCLRACSQTQSATFLIQAYMFRDGSAHGGLLHPQQLLIKKITLDVPMSQCIEINSSIEVPSSQMYQADSYISHGNMYYPCKLIGSVKIFSRTCMYSGTFLLSIYTKVLTLVITSIIF